MKYATVENNTIVSISSDELSALNYVIQKYPDAKYLSNTTEGDLNNAYYKEGTYIILNNNDVYLIEKTKTIIQGFFYNSEFVSIKRINQWQQLNIGSNIQMKYITDEQKVTKFNSKMPLSVIAKHPLILSIGTITKNHQQKINSIIKYNIINKNIKEEQIIIFTNASNKWNKKYPVANIYNRINENIFDTLTNIEENKINYFIIFDRTLNETNINDEQFINLVNNCKINGTAIIIITTDSDVILSKNLSNIDYTMIHTLTLDWNEKISSEFIKKYPVLTTQKELEKQLVTSSRLNRSMVFSNKITDRYEKF